MNEFMFFIFQSNQIEFQHNIVLIIAHQFQPYSKNMYLPSSQLPNESKSYKRIILIIISEHHCLPQYCSSTIGYLLPSNLSALMLAHIHWDGCSYLCDDIDSSCAHCVPFARYSTGYWSWYDSMLCVDARLLCMFAMADRANVEENDRYIIVISARKLFSNRHRAQ